MRIEVSKQTREWRMVRVYPDWPEWTVGLVPYSCVHFTVTYTRGQPPTISWPGCVQECHLGTSMVIFKAFIDAALIVAQLASEKDVDKLLHNLEVHHTVKYNA